MLNDTLELSRQTEHSSDSSVIIFARKCIRRFNRQVHIFIYHLEWYKKYNIARKKNVLAVTEKYLLG